MPDFPTIGANRFEAGVAAASSGGVVLTANATPNTKGSYVDLIASTLFEAQWLMVEVGFYGGGASDFLVDIAIGAASSEMVIASNLIFTGFLAIDHMAYYLFPAFVPAGSRISGRCQATTGSATVRCGVLLEGQGFLPSSPLSLITTYGAATADSGGVAIDMSSINTKGAYSQLTAATTHDINWLVLGIGGQNNQARTGARWLVDIAVGGAGSEVVIVPDLILNASGTGDCILPGCICLPGSIPAGSRVAVRAQCSINDATDRLFDAVLYGVS